MRYCIYLHCITCWQYVKNVCEREKLTWMKWEKEENWKWMKMKIFLAIRIGGKVHSERERERKAHAYSMYPLESVYNDLMYIYMKRGILRGDFHSHSTTNDSMIVCRCTHMCDSLSTNNAKWSSVAFRRLWRHDDKYLYPSNYEDNNVVGYRERKYANRINGLWNLIEIDCDTSHMCVHRESMRL